MEISEHLILRARDGDSEALGTLYQQTSSRVYALALRLTGNREQAMDVMQETYLIAMQNLHSLQHPQAFLSWLYRITARQCRLSRRKEGKYVLTDQEDEGGTPYFESLPDPDEAILPHQATEQADTRRLMLELVDSLPEEQRECVLLFYFSGCTVEQIAELQGCSTGTVKSRLNYARKKLKEAVVSIEERDHVRFHSFLPLGLLFRCTASELPDPAAFAELWNDIGAKLGISAATATGTAVAKATAATALKVKLAAGILAGAVAIGGAAAILHEPALTFTDPAMEHNVRLLLDKPSGALHTSDLESVDTLCLLDNGLSLEYPEDGLAPDGSQPLSSLEDLALFPDLENLCYWISDDGALLQTLPQTMPVTDFLYTPNLYLNETVPLEDLSFLDCFPELQRCWIRVSEETDLTPLESKGTIQNLSLLFSNSATLDVSEMTELEILNFDCTAPDGKISLQTSATLSQLRILSTYASADLGALSSAMEYMPALEYMTVYLDHGADLSLFSKLPSLRLLSLDFPITGDVDLTPLMDCASLELCFILNLPDDAIVPPDLPLIVAEPTADLSAYYALRDEMYNS